MSMTGEEAIKRLREILAEAIEFEDSVCYVTEEDREPLEMAIKALEQESCEDVILKYKKIVKIIRNYDLTWEFHNIKHTIDKIREVIENENDIYRNIKNYD